MNINLLHGDCLELMKDIPDKSIDLVLTDPPYGILGGSKAIGGSNLYKANEYNCEWDNQRMSEEQFKEIQRVSKNQIIFGYNYFTDYFPATNSLIIWDKKEKNNWFDNFSDGEIIWTSYKKPLRIYRHLWMGALRRGKRIRRVHPTQKPVELMEWIITHYSNPSDTILDPFMGSGTTGVACINLNRNFVGIELDDEYFEIAKQRINEARNKPEQIQSY